MPTLVLLTLSNLFMTTAWYWHLKGGPAVAEARPLGWVVLISWLLAGVEYSLAVPANRIGYAHGWTPGQLKIAQEAIALTVFGVFMVTVPTLVDSRPSEMASQTFCSGLRASRDCST